MPRHAMDNGRRGYVAEAPYARPLPRLPHPAMLEEELELQQSKMERIMADNRRLVEERIAMQQDIAMAQDELRRMRMGLADLQKEQDAHKRDLIERGLKLEADLRASEPLKNEAIQLRAEIQKLNAIRQDLSGQVQNLTQELTRAQAENKQIPLLKADIDGLHQELIRVRNAFEFEKKANAELAEQKQGMEKNLVNMAREVEKLRAVVSDSRPWAAGGAYALNFGSPEGGFSTYGNPYGLHSGLADKGPSYDMGSGPFSDRKKFGLGYR